MSLTINLGYLPQIWQSPSCGGIINNCYLCVNVVNCLLKELLVRLASDSWRLSIVDRSMTLSGFLGPLCGIYIYISVKLFGAHQGSDSVLMFIQTNRYNRSIASEFFFYWTKPAMCKHALYRHSIKKKKKNSKTVHVSQGDAIKLLCPCCSELNGFVALGRSYHRHLNPQALIKLAASNLSGLSVSLITPQRSRGLTLMDWVGLLIKSSWF